MASKQKSTHDKHSSWLTVLSLHFAISVPMCVCLCVCACFPTCSSSLSPLRKAKSNLKAMFGNWIDQSTTVTAHGGDDHGGDDDFDFQDGISFAEFIVSNASTEPVSMLPPSTCLNCLPCCRSPVPPVGPSHPAIPLPLLLAKGKTRIPPNSSRNSSRKPSEICPRYPLEICTSWPYDYRYICRYFLLEASIHIFFLYLAFWSYPKPRGTRCTKNARRHDVQLHSGSKKIIEINSIFMYLLNICLMLLIFCVCIIFCAL